MTVTRTPHNDFFYQVMSRKDKAVAFFERYIHKAESTGLSEAELMKLQEEAKS